MASNTSPSDRTDGRPAGKSTAVDTVAEKTMVSIAQKSYFSLVLIAFLASCPVVSPADELEEVVVTAQRREENIQKVDIAIAAFTEKDLRNLNIKKADEIAEFIPNVSVVNTTGYGQPVLVIRGVGLLSDSFQNAPAAAVYVDDVYQPNIVMGGFQLFDLERVEILKGPQAALYGRNTIGGAASYVSKRPEFAATNGYADVEYGAYGHWTVDGALGAALNDRLAFRIAATREVSDRGYQNDIYTGSDSFGKLNRWSARAQLRWKPIDDFDALLNVHGAKDNSETPLFRVFGTFAQLPSVIPGASTAFLTALQTGDFIGTLCEPLRSGGRPSNLQCETATGLTPSALGNNPLNVYSATPNSVNNDSIGGSLTAVWDLPALTLRSISAYDKFDYLENNNAAGLVGNISQFRLNGAIRAWSQEVRLTSREGERVSWLLGATYSRNDLTQPQSQLLFGDNVVFGQLIFHTSGIDSPYSLNNRSAAAYGQSEWRITDQWKLTGALRYTDERQDFLGVVTYVDNVPTQYLFPPGSSDYSFHNVSGKTALDWTPAQNVLVYGSYSRGFKAGGFYGGTLTDPNQLKPFNEETINAYEIGFKTKSQAGTLQLNGALFYYDYQHYQGPVQQPEIGHTLLSVTTNLGDAEFRGAELDAAWLPLDGLSMRMSMGLLDATIIRSPYSATDLLGTGVYPIQGANIPNYSKSSYAALVRYEHAVTASTRAAVQVNGTYRSSHDLNLILDKFDRALSREPGYGLVNAQISLLIGENKWELTAWGKNLANRQYRTSTGSDGAFDFVDLYGPPRAWGVRVSRHWN